MFDYPKAAEFNRPLPKSKIYNFAKPSRAVRELFVSQISEIVWKYKLSPETINLPARPGDKEIQVFEIALKTGELDEDVLRTIDKAIKFPIFYRLTFENRVKTLTAYKRPSEANPAKWVVESYFETPWRPAPAKRPPLPMALHLGSLYEQMLRRHVSLPPRQGEPLQSQIQRSLQIRAKERESHDLEARLRREKQFNRKVDINARIRTLKGELASLATATPHHS